MRVGPLYDNILKSYVVLLGLDGALLFSDEAVGCLKRDYLAQKY